MKSGFSSDAASLERAVFSTCEIHARMTLLPHSRRVSPTAAGNGRGVGFLPRQLARPGCQDSTHKLQASCCSLSALVLQLPSSAQVKIKLQTTTTTRRGNKKIMVVCLADEAFLET